MRGDLTLRLDDGTNTETFLRVARLRPLHLEIERRRVRLEGLLRACDAYALVSLGRLFAEGCAANWQIFVPGLGTLEGAFRIDALHVQGDDTRLSLASQGETNLAAVAASTGAEDDTSVE